MFLHGLHYCTDKDSALCLACLVEAYRLESILDLSTLKVQGSVALGAGALADILAAIALMFYLRKMRTGYARPDSLVRSLVRYAIHSGALTSTLSILAVIFFAVRPNTFDFIAPYSILMKAFAVSFMCTLNTQKLIAGHVIDNEQTGFGTSHDHITLNVPPWISTEADDRLNSIGFTGPTHADSTANSFPHYTSGGIYLIEVSVAQWYSSTV
ncbi:hypothetical protein GYMLUDRAFT_253126 [Collybiopsis luxurians FD-317 M1]|uniref:DUF6534 domain-containing protein n=1 Tax=Collybiopsis luxurians FD-317 M1 TaxID=944289 RepID=A0A0D0BXQ9_9AGAR|nr:hypothetical protein GYMLUDRAFT_253126 [Collybiopsis luxurians FD-317 M1]